jgi:Uma2 family endonuclease
LAAAAVAEASANAGKVEGCTSTEVLQEILYRCTSLGKRELARDVYTLFVDICPVVYGVDLACNSFETGIIEKAMAVAELVSAEQYLHASFEHDAEFVEGKIVERPVPTWEHASMQGFLIRKLWAVARRLGLFAVPEQRVQVSIDRFRVPDVCVVTDKPEGPMGRRIVTRPPYLCVEILSPEDTAIETLDKVREYLNFGVNWVWVIDPVSRAGQVHSPNGVHSVEDRIFATDRFSVDLAQAEY